MNIKLYPTFDYFFESYLEDFIEAQKYEGISLEEYFFSLIFEYAKITKALPFEDDEVEQEMKYIDEKFGKFLPFYLSQEFDIDELILTVENTKKISKIVRHQAFKIANFLKNELLKKEIEIAKNENRKPKDIKSVFAYTEEIQKNANSFFRGKIDLVELLQYLSENFHSTNLKTNDLTKFNQIFAYFNSKFEDLFERKGNLDKTAYKNLVFHLFGFDYEKREIKGATEKHQEQLENLSKEYYKKQENTK